MIRGFHSRLVAVFALATTGANSGLAQAAPAEASRPDKVEAESGERAPALGGARKDFETLKALRDFGPEAKSDTPRLVIPKMPTGPTPPVVLPPPSRAGVEKTGANWLVDAMEARRTTKESRNEEGRTLQWRADEQAEGREKREGTPTTASEKNRSKDRVEASNPFAQYLSGWISPQDYALLRPALESTFSADPRASNSAAGSLPGDGSARERGFGVLAVPGLSPPEPSSANPGKGRVNPYLEPVGGGDSLPPALPITPKSTGIAPSSLQTGLPGGAMTEPPPPEAPRSKPVDFAKPNPDEKYFKPLKRF